MKHVIFNSVKIQNFLSVGEEPLELNRIIKDARFIGYDFEKKCTFKYPESCLLYEPYMNKKPWKEEQTSTNPLI